MQFPVLKVKKRQIAGKPFVLAELPGSGPCLFPLAAPCAELEDTLVPPHLSPFEGRGLSSTGRTRPVPEGHLWHDCTAKEAVA